MAPAMRRGLGLAGRDLARGRQRLLLRLQLLADLRADAHQVGAGGLRVAAAEAQPHPGLGVVGDRHAATRRVEADDVAHPDVGAQIAGAPNAVAAGLDQADQGGADRIDRLLGGIERDPQIGQQDVERRLAIERQQQVAVGLGDLALARDRLAALRHARDQPHALAEHHARQAAREHAADCPMAADVAVATDRELQRADPPRGQAAEQIAGVGALSHLGDQLAEFRRPRIGMDQRRVGREAAHL
jgi:hypothetical protein